MSSIIDESNRASEPQEMTYLSTPSGYYSSQAHKSVFQRACADLREAGVENISFHQAFSNFGNDSKTILFSP